MRLLALGVVALAVVACSGPGAGIADRIRAADSPIIREVRFNPSNFFGHPDEIYVYLVSDATDAQIVEVWCSVIVPTGVDQLPPERVGLLRSGDLDPADISYGLSVLDKPSCTSDLPMVPQAEDTKRP